MGVLKDSLTACASGPMKQKLLPRCARPRGHAGLDRKWYHGLLKREVVSALSVLVAQDSGAWPESTGDDGDAASLAWREEMNLC
jgi:hypothetical protein